MLILDQFFEQPHKGHGAGHLLLAGAALEDLVGGVARQLQLGPGVAALGQEAAQAAAPLKHVGQRRVVGLGPVVGRQFRVSLELGVGDGDVQAVAQALEILQP